MPGFPPRTSPSIFYGPLSQAHKDLVIKHVREIAAMRFRKYREVLKESLGLPDLKGPALLEAYRNRTPDVWAQLQSRFPDEYGRQITQWGKMEQNIRPEPSPVLASPSAKLSPVEVLPREGV
jgi:hypothetical protein